MVYIINGNKKYLFGRAVALAFKKELKKYGGYLIMFNAKKDLIQIDDFTSDTLQAIIKYVKDSKGKKVSKSEIYRNGVQSIAVDLLPFEILHELVIRDIERKKHF